MVNPIPLPSPWAWWPPRPACHRWPGRSWSSPPGRSPRCRQRRTSCKRKNEKKIKVGNHSVWASSFVGRWPRSQGFFPTQQCSGGRKLLRISYLSIPRLNRFFSFRFFHGKRKPSMSKFFSPKIDFYAKKTEGLSC